MQIIRCDRLFTFTNVRTKSTSHKIKSMFLCMEVMTYVNKNRILCNVNEHDHTKTLNYELTKKIYQSRSCVGKETDDLLKSKSNFDTVHMLEKRNGLI